MYIGGSYAQGNDCQYVSWGEEIPEISKGIYNVKIHLQDPERWAKIAFCPSQSINIQAAGSYKSVTLPVSKTCQWTVNGKAI